MRKESQNTKLSSKHSLRVGVIGFGRRIQGVLSAMQGMADLELVGVTDVRNEQIRDQMQDSGKNPESVHFYDDADRMLDEETLDGVLVGTRCSLHTQMACKALKRNIPLYLEKPVATTMADLMALRDASRVSQSEVVVSFPLRVTPLVQVAKDIIDAGEIGTVEHVQAVNNVPYGMVYYMDWYRDETETRGLWLQKATHDFDYLNYLLGIRPISICAMTSKQIMKGPYPAGHNCDECLDWEKCLESPFHIHYSRGESAAVTKNGLMCAFAEDTGNEDSGSALIRYESGMHLSYSQNFFARRSAGKRGATLLGYKGTLEFDWYTDEVKVIMHHKPQVVTHKMESSSFSHGGGDTVLADNFVAVMQGRQQSVSPIDAGLLSVLMCLKAKESEETKTYKDVAYPDNAPLPDIKDVLGSPVRQTPGIPGTHLHAPG